MKSETNLNNKIQIRIGKVTHDSYLFFPREHGDLLLEPGDKIILVATKGLTFERTNLEFRERKGIFNKIRRYFITKWSIHKLENKEEEFEAFETLKTAINTYAGGRRQRW